MTDTAYQQARRAFQAGQRQQALGLSREAIRQDPNDHRAWLLLAALTADPQKSREYVQRAEMLQPHDPTVQKARAWAEKRLPAVPPAEPQKHPQKGHTAVFFLAAWLIVLALGAGGLLVWATLPGADALTLWQTAVPQPLSPTPIVANLRITPTPVSTLASAAHSHNLAKAIAPADQNNAHRPAWTLTPTPTITPTPTPTLVPTFVSAQNQQWGLRPFGVGPDERWIDVDLSRQTLTAYEGDQAVYTTLVSSGLSNHPTVTGLFRIYLRYPSQTMNGYLLGYDYYLENVPHVMYFYQDYALHGAYWHNNFGYPMSHGCVNLDEPDAAWLYDWSSYGTVVNVHH